MSSSPAEIVNAQLRAYNARDTEAFIATYAEDACIYSMPGERLEFRGHAQIAAHYGGKTFQNPALQAQILARLVVGNKVIDHERATGVREEPIEVLVIYEVQAGLIQNVWFHPPDQAAPPAAD
ncbi:nuclear transport factor 2 family protein [Roseateles sp. DAIF2]|uniref:nuclear transport factor 2 family protein n=1 Tax=Roseateles sp. DAIF2 TaxID=2714952 RepID=UPI001BC94B75|nr:nuclear transport factor 2 family protein [Roseateles sp. DAIF2]